MNKNLSNTRLKIQAGLRPLMYLIAEVPWFGTDTTKKVIVIETPSALIEYALTLMTIRCSPKFEETTDELKARWQKDCAGLLHLLDADLGIPEHNGITDILNDTKAALQLQQGREKIEFHITPEVMRNLFETAMSRALKYFQARNAHYKGS